MKFKECINHKLSLRTTSPREKINLHTTILQQRINFGFFFWFSFLCEGKKAHNFRWTLTRVLSVAKTEPSTAHRRPHHCQTTSSRNRKKKNRNRKKKKSHWTYSRQKITSPSKCICEKQISHIWMKFLWCSCVFVVDIFYKLHCYCIYRCSSVFKCAS